LVQTRNNHECPLLIARDFYPGTPLVRDSIAGLTTPSNKKADVVEHPEAFHHVGLLVNGSSAVADHPLFSLPITGSDYRYLKIVTDGYDRAGDGSRQRGQRAGAVPGIIPFGLGNCNERLVGPNAKQPLIVERLNSHAKPYLIRWVDDAVGDGIQLNPSQKLRSDLFTAHDFVPQKTCVTTVVC
jgi:hypothetical protein